MRNCTGKRYSQSYLATIIGSSSCLVNFAVSLLLTNDDSGSARLLARVTGRSPSALLSLCKTRSSLRIFDVGASSARSEMLGCGERLRIVRSSERAMLTFRKQNYLRREKERNELTFR